MLVPHTIPIRAACSDDRMKKMVHAELQDYGDFGLTNVSDKILFLLFNLFSYLNIFLKKKIYYYRFRKMKLKKKLVM